MKKKILKIEELNKDTTVVLPSIHKVIGGIGGPCCGSDSESVYINDTSGDIYGSGDWDDEGCC